MAHSPEEPRDGDPADEDRNAILRRRGAFVSAALAAVAGGAMLSVACSPEPCLLCPLNGCSDDRPLCGPLPCASRRSFHTMPRPRAKILRDILRAARLAVDEDDGHLQRPQPFTMAR
jgi:hypothetical protein